MTNSTSAVKELSGSTMLNRAIVIANEAHTGQVDKNGNPYILHPIWVANHVTGTVRQTIAMLHDVLEDTPVTVDDLRDHGFPENVITCVEALTKRDNEPNEDSMNRILNCGHPEARDVKLADIGHNTSPDRTADLDDATRERLARKYDRSARNLGTTVPEIHNLLNL